MPMIHRALWRALSRTALCALALLAARPAQADCPTRSNWPVADWESADAQTRAQHPSQVKALEDMAFALTGEPEEQLGLRTDAVLIIKHGRIVYEKYGRGYTPQMKHLAWSMTKNYMHAFTGIALAQGRLTLDDSICQHFPTKNPEACKIKVRDLLNWASGLDWTEEYEGKSNQASSVLAMLYGVGRGDMANFVASHPLRDAPGSTYMYSTGDSTLFAAVLGGAFKDLGPEWPWPALFDRLGMKNTTLETDPQGTFVGGSYLFATPRDFARFALLYASDGCWNGERILPEGWVRSAMTPNPAFLNARLDDAPEDVPGPHWWLNQGVAAINRPVPYPSAPLDMLAQEGHWGQFIFVFPASDVIVLRLGDDRHLDMRNRLDEFLRLSLAVAEVAE